MDFLVYLSYYMIPLLIFYIVGFGVLQKVDVYQEFVKGAKDGMKTVVELLPTLIGLLMGVGILRSSGALDLLAVCLAPVAHLLHFDAALLPVSIIKLFSSSAATTSSMDSGAAASSAAGATYASSPWFASITALAITEAINLIARIASSLPGIT